MNESKTCPNCCGNGRLEIECCNGAGGCSCAGGLVDVGPCRVCEGSGRVGEYFNPRANVNYLESTGAGFAGSGPTDGSWPNINRLGGRQVDS